MPKKIAQIPYISKSRNAEHYGLQEAFLAIITSELADEYKFSSLRNKYQSAFNREDEAYLQCLAFADTKLIEERDRLRIQRYRLFDLTVQSKLYSLIPSEVEAAEKMKFAMSPYTRVISRPSSERSAMLIDLVKKFQLEEYESILKSLGLTEALEALKTANDDFLEAYSRRADEKRIRMIREKLLRVRKEVDSSFKEVVAVIDAYYLMSELINQDATVKAVFGKLIDDINSQIVQFTETLSRRGVGIKAKIDSDKPVVDPDPSDKPGGDDDDHPVIE